MRLIHVSQHISHRRPGRVKNAFCMACSMRQLILRAHGGRSPFSPDMITNKIQGMLLLPLAPASDSGIVIAKHLRRGRQEDSHEFLRYAIDALQKSCLAGQPPLVLFSSFSFVC